MFAIVEACGRQYQIEAGRFVDIDLADAAEGDTFRFDKVLMIVDGSSSTLGSPYIDGAKVTGKVVAHRKGPKVIVYHMRPKKGTRKKQGHRQHLTRVAIETIELKDQVLAKAEAKEKVAKKEEAPAAASKKAAPKAEAKAKEPNKEAKKDTKTAKKPAKESK